MSEPVYQQRGSLNLRGEGSQIDPLFRGMRTRAFRTQAVEPVDLRRDERDVSGATTAGVEGLHPPMAEVSTRPVQGGEELVVPLGRAHGRVLLGEAEGRLRPRQPAADDLVHQLAGTLLLILGDEA